MTVSQAAWAKFLDIYVPRTRDGLPLRGKSLTLADKKRDALQRLYRHDQRV